MIDIGKCPSKREFSIQKYLDSVPSGLAKVSFTVDDDLCVKAQSIPGFKHSAAQWLGRVGEQFSVDPRWILTTMQAEQSLPLDKTVRSPDCVIQVLNSPVMGLGNLWKVRGKQEWVRVIGDWKMCGACGAGIFLGGECIEPCVFGFPAQAYYCAKWTRRYLDSFASKSDNPLQAVAVEWVGLPEAGPQREAIYRRMFLS